MKKVTGIQKVIVRMMIIILISLGAIVVYSSYPRMREEASKISGNFYESDLFFWELSDGAHALGATLQEGESSDFYEIAREWNQDYEKDVDYYIRQGDQVLESNGQQLSRVLNNELTLASSDMTSAYQYVIVLQFDEEGTVNVKELLGADIDATERQLRNHLFNYSPEIKGVEMVFGVHKTLSTEGLMNLRMENHLESGYIFIVACYLIGITLIVLTIVFITPFSWLLELSTVRGLLLIPLELRFLFVIATAIASAFAPMLVILTQTNLWEITMNPVLLHWVNLVCWGGFIAVVFVHSLYLKEFFVIGPWQMIRRHTIIGQLVYFWTRPKVVFETKTVENVIFKEDPRVELIMSRLELFKESLVKVKASLENQDDVEEVAIQLDSILKLCTLNRPKTSINLTKLVSDTLVQLEQEYLPLEVKLRFPEKMVSIQANEEDLKLWMESLLHGIAASSLPKTRVYLELVDTEETVVLTTRSVIESEVDHAWEVSLDKLADYQGARFETLMDGDLLKTKTEFKK